MDGGNSDVGQRDQGSEGNKVVGMRLWRITKVYRRNLVSGECGYGA